ncbi:putative disease resistance RPP13-like protein 3 [Triticum aestivum]|uniref:putative disease resistance RPP13-like protein 3 n=1 Tax=Triticum aestivum TaxID=4565 RepID=UPI001D01998C|nr:putative disease resistance RPP13-like protein 3 [Triticum aestivum]
MIHSSLRAYAASGGWSKPSPVQITWVRQLRELADDIEDCHLDFTILRGVDLAARYRVAKRVRHLQDTVKDLHKRRAFAADHGLPAQEPHEDDDEYLRRPVLPDERRQGQIIGRDDDKKALAKLVRKGASRVVWVWGTAGVGKSSLARMLYEDPDVVRRFDCRAWVTVPHRLESPAEFGRLLEKQLGVGVDDRGGVSAWLREKG